MKTVYMNCAATSFPKPDCVISAMAEAMRTTGNAARGASGMALSSARMLTELREEVAALFSFQDPSRVIFTKNITEALNTALYGILLPGDHVIATDLDHNAVLRPLYDLESHRGAAVSFVPADKKGNVDYDDFERLIRKNTKVIVCPHASNLTGNVLDIDRIGRIARAHHIIFILDTAQTAGVIPIFMEKSGVDILCFTGHKSLMGPQGTGGLLVGKNLPELKPLIRGGTGILSFEKDQPEQYPEHLEAGTLNTPGLAGLLAALRFVKETGTDRIRSHEEELTRRFYDKVCQIPGITIYGDFGEEESKEAADKGYPTVKRPHMAIVSLNLEGISSSELADILYEDYGIEVRAGGHCAPRMHMALGTEKTGAVRFSFGWFTTKEEIDYAADALSSIQKQL